MGSGTSASQPSLFDSVDEPPDGSFPASSQRQEAPSSHLLGLSHQAQLEEEGLRRSAGAFYTPPDVVEGLLDLTLAPLLEGALTVRSVAAIRVLDPACGSGNFLVAAGQRIKSRLVALGASDSESSRIAFLECVVGVDIDSAAAAICRTVLNHHGGVTDTDRWERQPARVFVFDSLLTPLAPGTSLFESTESGPASWCELCDEVGAGEGFDLVIGNPPFLNQLETETAVGANGLALLRARFGGTAGAYTDLATLFLILATELVRKVDGLVCLIEPVSLLSARHAQPARDYVLHGSHLRTIWFASERVFDAAVDVCAIVLQTRDAAVAATSIVGTRRFEPSGTIRPPTPGETSWSYLLAYQRGLPDREFAVHDVLRSLATATADFRDHYYGLADHVIDSLDGDPFREPPLVTAGLIDPAECLWGVRPTKFNKRSYLHPRVRVDSLTPKLQQWARQRLVPKLLLATQTRVLEVVVDADGSLLPSVPVVTITAGPEDLWRIGAMLTSPPVTLIAAQRHLGAALSVDALKLSASDVLLLPLPADQATWGQAAHHFRLACEAPTTDTRTHLERSAVLMCAAYGVPEDDELMVWWADRLRRK